MSAPTLAPRPKRTPWEIQRAVLFALLQREMKARFEGRWLGAFWVLLEPIAHLSYMMVLYGVIRGRVMPGVPFVMFLLTGIVPFIMFRSVSLRVMGSVDGSRGLFGYRQVKPIDPIIARAALDVLLYSLVFVIFLAVFGWFGLKWIPDHPLEVIASIAVLILFGFGLGLLFVVLTDDFPKVRVFIRLAYLPLYLISGVIFPTTSLPQEARDWMLWNPLLHVMEDIHGSFFNEYEPIPEASLAYPSAVALITLATAFALYRLRHKRLLAT
jgi:capsular polysaccharide transport system permease protein